MGFPQSGQGTPCVTADTMMPLRVNPTSGRRAASWSSDVGLPTVIAMSTGPTAPPALAAWFAPWRQGRVARALAHVSLDIVIGTITFSIIFTLLVTATSIVLLFPLAVALVWVALEASHVVARGWSRRRS